MVPTNEDKARDLVADLGIATGLKSGGLLGEWARLALQAAIRRALAAEGELRHYQLSREESLRGE